MGGSAARCTWLLHCLAHRALPCYPDALHGFPRVVSIPHPRPSTRRPSPLLPSIDTLSNFLPLLPLSVASQATKVVRAKLLSVQNKAVKADRNEQRASFNEYKYVLIQVRRGDAVLGVSHRAGATPCMEVQLTV